MVIEVLSGKVFLVITGASRGIGAEIVLQFSRFLAPGSRILLLARDAEKLKNIALKVPQQLKVDYESVDLSVATKNELEGILKKSLGPEGTKNFDRAVIIHNAGSLGDITKTTKDMDDFDEWRKYYDLNVFSPAVLNSIFMKLFPDESNVEKLVINITSLCAIQPMKSVGFYSSGKAARESYFKTFAMEFPKVNVLNWSPGPVDTEMCDFITTKAGDSEIRDLFRKMREDNAILTTEQTVNRLILVLNDQKYKSGDHVDYFDQL